MDALRLEQAARNLLEDAITFSPGGCLDVSVQQVAGDQVELVVWDRGLEGWRRRSGRTSSSPFTRRMGAATEGGIGTRYQAGIVAQHGGTIRAAFPDEGGTRMVVPLPGGDRSP